MKYFDLFKLDKSNIVDILNKDIKSTRIVLIKYGLSKYRESLGIVKEFNYQYRKYEYVYYTNSVTILYINFYKHIKFYIRKYGSKYTRDKFIRIGLSSLKKYYWYHSTFNKITETGTSLKPPFTVKESNDTEEFENATYAMKRIT